MAVPVIVGRCVVPMRSLLGAVLLCSAAARDTVNFDFAWRHQLGTSHVERCGAGEVGMNYGTGGSAHKNVKDAGACCALCVSDPACGCWDLDMSDNTCWTKSECSSRKEQKNRTSALLARPTPPSPSPPESQPDFDDSTWALVDAPHDMLIHQKLDPQASNKMGYYQRNVGWYRKHFKLPAEWQGSSVWLYFDGVFHATTLWLNGEKISFHEAGYTAFWLRLDNVRGVGFGSAENVLALYVNASTGTGWWYEGGGLSRHNWLVRASPTHIEQDGAWIYTDQTADGGATFHASVAVVADGSQPAGSVAVKTTIKDTAGSTVAMATSPAYTLPLSDPIVVSATAASGIKTWSVQSPHLYTAHIELVSAGDTIDAITLTTGVRTVRFDAEKGLFLNDVNIKMRGFCDHSSFAGVGAAVPDRIELFRAQALRAVGGNAWRMAHNPPAISRLDYMDALGMLALDENRDYGGNNGQGGNTGESVADELKDMRDLIKRDRSHPSVIWWSFCNEVGCNNESAARAFREVSKLWDPTRAVTQNHIGSNTSTFWLDVQGFSHKKGSVFDDFHVKYPHKPMAATECCSCMSQRGVDEDVCPHPKDGGCENGPQVPAGTFYNNNIGKCTADQVIQSDTRETVAGTFIWSGFDYLGEARGWPQNTKCRGTVSDVAGFTKETAYWIKSVWLSNISADDPGRPNDAPGATGNTHTTFIIESWVPPPSDMNGGNRSIHVYSNAAAVRLELNGKEVGTATVPHYDAMVAFTVKFEPGTLTAVSLDGDGRPVGSSHSISTTGAVAAVVLSLDAPSATTGTGSVLVADGEDSAMVRATLVDAKGLTVPFSNNNVTFSIESGPGKIWTTHNGDPANLHSNDDVWTKAYHGLARAIIRTTADHATPAEHRRLMRAIDVDGGKLTRIVDPNAAAAEPLAPIVVKAIVEAKAGTTFTAFISIPLSADLANLPGAIARKY